MTKASPCLPPLELTVYTARVTGTVLVQHDYGCKWGRATDVDIDSEGRVLSAVIGPGHSDAAKRFADSYNLHKAAGNKTGWIAVALADGSSGNEVYDSRAEAVRHKFPRERWFFYCTLRQPSMTVCAAESLLRFQRVMNEVAGAHTDRDAPGGGLEVIPRLSAEDIEAQIEAVRTGRGFLAFGRR